MRKLLANVVQETSPTAGTGTITLAEMPGWMRFSDRFAVGDTVYYSIRDGTNWELGKGTVGSNNTLVRTTVLETLTGSTPLLGGGPLTLSGGGAIVRAVITEELFSTLLKVENVLVSASQVVSDGYSYGIVLSNITLTMSSSPQVGDRIEFYQAGSSVASTVLDPNGSKINGVVGPMTIDVPDFYFWVVYINSTYGWKIK
jgi:hypothetical protein